MLYRFGKAVMWVTLHFYFRRIIFSGKKQIPADDAAILIANHSASFLDAMLLGSLIRRPLHFFSRGDIFKNAWANKILRSFHMIPIYKGEHGQDNMNRNQETFSEGEAVLNSGDLLLVFPEGTSRVERIMLPLKKGTARIALQTESKQDFSLGLKVIPVGINFSAHRFRADILIHVGEFTNVADYDAVFRENPTKAVTQLNRELEAKFAQTIIYVAQPERTGYINRLLELFRADSFHDGIHVHGAEILQKEKMVCDQVSTMSDEEFQERWNLLRQYDVKLEQNGLLDRSVNGRYQFIVWHLFLLLISLPFFLVSLVLNILPIWFGKWIADTRVTRIDFYTSVSAAAGGFGYIIWWLILIGLAAFIGNTWIWICVLCAPILLFLGMFWWESFVKMVSHARFLLKGRSSALVRELREMRKGIVLWQRA